MSTSTADLYDKSLSDGAPVQVAEGHFLAFGRRRAFSGPIRTLKVHEDNALVRSALEERGEGCVLVIDGGGSLRAALLGDQLATLAMQNGWAGIVVWGAIRDSVAIDALEVGVRCLATTPRRSEKRGFGEREVPVSFAGVRFAPGAHLYADSDGILVSSSALSP